MYNNLLLVGIVVLYGLIVVKCQDPNRCMTTAEILAMGDSDRLTFMPGGFQCNGEEECDATGFADLLCSALRGFTPEGIAAIDAINAIDTNPNRRLLQLEQETTEQLVESYDAIDDCPIFETANCPVSGGSGGKKIRLSTENFADSRPDILDAGGKPQCHPLSWRRDNLCRRADCSELHPIPEFFCEISQIIGGCYCLETLDRNPICINAWPYPLVQGFDMYCNKDRDCDRFSFFGTEYGCIDKCIYDGGDTPSGHPSYRGVCIPECWFPQFPKDRFKHKKISSPPCLTGFTMDAGSGSCIPCCGKQPAAGCNIDQVLNDAGGCTQCSTAGSCATYD